jgi:hypothetical protein
MILSSRIFKRKGIEANEESLEELKGANRVKGLFHAGPGSGSRFLISSAIDKIDREGASILSAELSPEAVGAAVLDLDMNEPADDVSF